jgi:glycosyltransferase involved in cell wall biosynthesis
MVNNFHSQIEQMNVLVSIIIPCHNSSKYLSETLQNILLQTYSNFECILVDDGSIDDTRLIAKSFVDKDSRFKYYYKENGGVSTARNTGVKFSSGEFIQFLDADDLLHPNKLKLQLEYLLGHNSVDIVYGEYSMFNQPDEINFNSANFNKHNYTKIGNWEKENILNYFIRDNITSIHAALIKRKVVETVSFDPNIRNCEDYDFWFNAALNGFHFSYDYSPETVGYYRKHAVNKSSNSSRMNYYRSLIKQKYMGAIKKRNPELFPVLYRGFLLNHRRYLFEKEKKNSADILYTLKLSYKYFSIRLLWITLEYIVVPNRIWKLVHWNGGLIKYLRIKVQSNFP